MPDERELKLDTLNTGDALAPTVDTGEKGDRARELPVVARELYHWMRWARHGGSGRSV